MTFSDSSARAIHVVAGAVTDADGRVLIAQRTPGKHLAGRWEFPGGKLEPGEVRTVGLARELREELGITIGLPRPLIRVRHTYPYGEVLIDMWVVSHYDGEPRGLDGQALRWCSQDELAEVDLLPADKPIVRALRLPERLERDSTPYYTVSKQALLRQPIAGVDVTADTGLHGVFCANFNEAQVAVAGGAEFLVMSEAVGDTELGALCAGVPVPVFACGIQLERAWALGASGLNELVLTSTVEES